MTAYLFRPAEEQDAETIHTLYRSLAGTPFCAWDDSYPGREQIADDLAAHALYCLCDSSDLIAAAAIRHWEEHDAYAFWSPEMKRPCDLLRLGVSRSLQGRGIGRCFLTCLRDEASRKGFDGMRILVAETNHPARALYRKIGAEVRGNAVSYGIRWECLEWIWKT